MFKRLQGLIAGMLIGALFTGGAVFAKQISETADLFYNNIKLYVDGGEIVPKDANGNITEPFTMNGTTYLPVRAISNAFGKDVEWDGATQSIYIGKKDQTKPDNYLDKIQYNDFEKGTTDCSIDIINGMITDYQSNIYTNGLLFFIRDCGRDLIENDNDNSNIIIAYPLNSQYKKITGKIVLPKEYEFTTGTGSCSSTPTDIFVYGDGKLLYKATEVTKSLAFAFDINISGVNQLTIKVKGQGYSHSDTVALTDLALYK